MVGYDGSEGSLKALRLAIKIAGALSSRVIVVHVCEENRCGEEVFEEARLILAGSNVNGEVRALHYDSSSSSPAFEIISFSKEIGAQLVVLGATGVSCKDICSLGSVAASVAINSPTSVLIVR